MGFRAVSRVLVIAPRHGKVTILFCPIPLLDPFVVLVPCFHETNQASRKVLVLGFQHKHFRTLMVVRQHAWCTSSSHLNPRTLDSPHGLGLSFEAQSQT